MKQLARATVILSLMIGCDSEATEDKLEVSFVPYSTPVKVDTFCDNGGCTGEKGVVGKVSFDTDKFVAKATEVEFHKYRVDYDLSNFNKKTPYFADDIDFTVSSDQTGSFTVSAAGQTQRIFIYNAVGGKRINGTATLTFAGYDNDGEQVLLEKPFDISFGDFYVSGEDADGSTNP